jgi:hypothetical protein
MHTPNRWRNSLLLRQNSILCWALSGKASPVILRGNVSCPNHIARDSGLYYAHTISRVYDELSLCTGKIYLNCGSAFDRAHSYCKIINRIFWGGMRGDHNSRRLLVSRSLFGFAAPIPFTATGLSLVSLIRTFGGISRDSRLAFRVA